MYDILEICKCSSLSVPRPIIIQSPTLKSPLVCLIVLMFDPIVVATSNSPLVITGVGVGVGCGIGVGVGIHSSDWNVVGNLKHPV